jgi:hypothetical protein
VGYRPPRHCLAEQSKAGQRIASTAASEPARRAASEPADRAVLGRPIEPGEGLFTVRSGERIGWVLAGGVAALAALREEFGYSLPEAIDALNKRHMELRKTRPQDFT